MKLPSDTIIAPEKLSHYLLRPRDDHDKSGFLAMGGYGPTEADQLERDLRTQLLPLEAAHAGTTEYGEKLIIRGTLTGPNGRALKVLSVWMLEKPSGLTKFITLYPDHT
jgi:hypothetical protein